MKQKLYLKREGFSKDVSALLYSTKVQAVLRSRFWLEDLRLKFTSHTQLGAMPSRPCNLTFITSTPQIISVTPQKRANKRLNEIDPRYKNNLTRALLEIYNNPKNIQGGWAGQVRQQKQLNPEMSCDLKDPPTHTLEPILPAVCEKNVFPFFRSSATLPDKTNIILHTITNFKSLQKQVIQSDQSQGILQK